MPPQSQALGQSLAAIHCLPDSASPARQVEVLPDPEVQCSSPGPKPLGVRENPVWLVLLPVVPLSVRDHSSRSRAFPSEKTTGVMRSSRQPL